ncbi:MAG: serine/threonine protein kinase [Deltaproteobacteria bacterium]|nr:MAG: serine/threonine protein kinase [Deltaproteobacteria bacterium]
MTRGDETAIEAPAARRRRRSRAPGGRAGDGAVTDDTGAATGDTGAATGDTASHGTAGGGSAGGPASDPRGPAVRSPADALRLDEIARTRRLLPMVLGLCVAAAVALPWIGGDPRAKALLYAGVVLSSLSSLWLHRITRDDAHGYTNLTVAAAWLSPSLTIVAAILYFGPFSPAPILAVLAVYLIGLGRSRTVAATVYGLLAAGQAGLAALAIANPDGVHSLVRADYLGLREQIIGQALVQAVLAATLFTARLSRRAALQAFEELDRAVRAIAQRDALIDEVRADLDRAMQIGGRGRFTGRRVGSFQLGVVIGRGAMGEVYEARHVDTGGEAAVKLLHPAAAGDDFEQRFHREVKAAAAVASPHIVRVIEVSPEGAALPYLAMERLRGQDLAQLLRDRRRLGKRALVKLAREVGAGIEAAGNAGIVHRDIKPQNLFLHRGDAPPDPHGREGTWKILDFGVSKVFGGDGTLTHGRVVGTPVYMAPEQAQGKDVDSRADLYALAAILYRALTGVPPFRGKDTPEILYRVVYDMPRRPTAIVDVPADVDAWFAIALAKHPDDRFFTADELCDALEAALAGALDDDWRERGRRLLKKATA